MPGVSIDTSGLVPELYLYGRFSEDSFWVDDAISAAAVLAALKDLGKPTQLVARINSPGGSVFEAVAIYNALVRHEAHVRVEIDALAASAAAIVAMAGDEIVMAGNASMMIHRAWTIAMGNAEEIGKVVEALKTVDELILNTFDARTGDKSTRDAIEGWVNAETWMTPEQAVERGFADRVGELRKGVAANVPAGMFKNTPRHLLAAATPPESSPPAKAPQSGYATKIAALRHRVNVMGQR